MVGSRIHLFSEEKMLKKNIDNSIIIPIVPLKVSSQNNRRIEAKKGSKIFSQEVYGFFRRQRDLH